MEQRPNAARGSLEAAWRALAASRFADARSGFAAAVSHDPDDEESLVGLALTFWQGGDRFAALGAVRRAAALAAASTETYLLFGAFARRIGDLDGALSSFEAAHAKEPGSARALLLLSDAYRRALRPGDALDAARKALRCDPSSIASVVALGDALLANEALDDAEKTYRVALALDRRAFGAAFGLGRLALARAAWTEAQAAFERAATIEPDNADARYQLALLDVRFGRYAEGFAAYPAIMDTDSDGARYYYHHEGVPRWSGEPLSGRRLVIASDQGLGDHIMAARFFARLPADANVVVETPPELMSLFEHNFRALRFERFTHWRPARDVDVHLPITQLATIAGIRTAAEIDGSPYLRAVPEQVDAWRRRLGGAPNVRRVGVVWHGNVRNARDRWRAAPLRAWAPLARLEGVQFHALQVDATDAELRDAPIRLEPTHARIGDMADTAALMTALDAVVSVDTATAHLAGALGCPVWLPNPLVSDYRWGVDRADSPWYSSMRVVRQRRRDDWEPVFEQIAHELQAR